LADVVIVDEFHHAAASSYLRLLEHIAPAELLGLTATPERSDGLSVLRWFDDRIAAELRLWDAIDQHRLVPFAYYGVADSLDLRDIPWQRGRGYDVQALSQVITSTDIWARQVLQPFLPMCACASRFMQSFRLSLKSSAQPFWLVVCSSSHLLLLA
jgi:superfamily II DNA or RNA helicase